jgi:excisionase family DNA binding protein
VSLERLIAEEIRRAVDEAVPRAVERALRELLPAARPEPAATTTSESRMTPRQVAERFQRDVSTVRRWAREKRLASLHVNGRLLFRTADVDAFEAAGGAAPCGDQPPDPKVVALRILRGS